MATTTYAIDPGFLFVDDPDTALGGWRFREFVNAEAYAIECDCCGDDERAPVARMETHVFRWPPRAVITTEWRRLQVQRGACPRCGVNWWACVDLPSLVRLSERRLVVVLRDKTHYEVRVDP